MYSLSKRSFEKLEGCHEDLYKLASIAIITTPYDFGITCGLRTREEQKKLVAEGKSQTMNSRHLPVNGQSRAFDFMVYVGGHGTWREQYYRPVVQNFFNIAIQEGIQIKSGGLWGSFEDWPHIELITEG